MTDRRLGAPASKAEQKTTPADRQLHEQRRRAGLAHTAVAASGGTAPFTRSAAVEQAFAEQFHRAPAQAQKGEHTGPEPDIARLRLSSDGGTLLAAMKSEIKRNNGRPVDVVADRAGEVLGIGRERASSAKEELLRRGFIRPVVNSIGGTDGYRVLLPLER